MCQRVELRVSQLSADKQKLKLICPRCNREKTFTLEELEELEGNKEEESVASSDPE